jgi:hypothetical protein
MVLLVLAASSSALLGPVIRGEGRPWKTISPTTRAAVEAIPRGNELVLTNELGFDRQRPYVPLLNVWAPALYGHRFWASAFMFSNNWNAADASQRLAELEWFFTTRPGSAHLDWLRRCHVTHVLVRRDLLALSGWESSLRALGLPVVFESSEYVVVSVTL